MVVAEFGGSVEDLRLGVGAVDVDFGVEGREGVGSLGPVHTSVIPASERESMRRLSAARRIEMAYKRAWVGSSGPPALGAESGLDSSVRWNDGSAGMTDPLE